jgi:hypothetical protein
MQETGIDKLAIRIRLLCSIPLLSARVQRRLVGQLLGQHSPVKIHLGCGTEHLEGYLNIDVNPKVGPDLAMSVDCLNVFPCNSVDIIESYHLLEHFHLNQARRALQDWFRVLKRGGLLVAELPNFARCIETIGQHFDDAGVDLSMGGIYGYPLAIDLEGDWQVHKWGWTFESLKKELESIGFEDCQLHPIRQVWRPANRFNRDMQVRAFKP